MSYSKLALGCMRLSKLSLEEAEELILCAVENGIKLFDHADIYGRRECERLNLDNLMHPKANLL